MEKAQEKRIKIGAMQGTAMIFVALAIDGVQFLINFIPLVGWIFVSILSIGVAFMFWSWFKLNGVSFLRGKAALLRVATISIGAFIEIFPVLNSLPAWTGTVIIMLVIVKLEDGVQNIGVGNLLSPSRLLRKNTNKNGRINRRKGAGLVRASTRIARKAILKV